MCLTADEARVVNKTFNAEEYWRMSDSLCEASSLLLRKQIALYENVVGIDSANADDRVMQIAVWKSGYESQKLNNSNCMKALKEMTKEKEKQEHRKKVWRSASVIGIPLAFFGGILFVLVN